MSLGTPPAHATTGKKKESIKTPKPRRCAVRLLRLYQPLDVDSIEEQIPHHLAFPHSICAHVDHNEPENIQQETRSSTLISLNARTIYVTDGVPCKNEYQRFSLEASRAFP